MIKNLLDYMTCTEDNATPASVKAVAELCDGDILKLGGGEIHLYPEGAFIKEYYISNNDYGLKPIAFPIINKKNITVDGEGAKLIFHGKVMPFVIDESENITVKNLTIDYAEPMYFEAKIVDSSENHVEMEYDDSVFHVDALENNFRFYGDGWENITDQVLVNEFDPEMLAPDPKTDTYFAYLGNIIDTSFHADIFRYLKASKPAPDRLRLDGKFKVVHKVGKYWVCTHNSREFPGFFCNDSKDISLENITLNHTLAMGVICQMCENISLDGIVAVPSEGRMLSVDADATHFVNCSGLIHINNCRFESMMDDAGNIHGIYMPIKAKVDANTVELGYGHFQQVGVNIFKTGDKVRIVDNKTMQPYAEFTVASSVLVNKDLLRLTTVEALPDKLPEGHVFENHSRMPSVHIENTRSGFNRPRGFLLATNRSALVENCLFYNLYSGISIMGDANSWFESGPCGEVVIRNCRFDNASYIGDPVIKGMPEIETVGDTPYHGSLTVENCHFRTNGKRFAQLFSFDKVVFKNNTFKEDSFGVHEVLGDDESGFEIIDCKNVEIEEI